MSEQNPHACGDGGCVLLVPGIPVGMHTNGGCRCMPLKTTPNDRVKFRAGIRWLAERAAGAPEVLTNCFTCSHDRVAAEDGISACGILIAGDERPRAWLDGADCGKDGYPNKTTTGCPCHGTKG
jgi:hypothetical protein